MDGIVQIGPLVMATDRLLSVGLMLAFILALDRIALRSNASSLKVGTVALIAGIAAARLAFVAKHLDAFSRDWWSALAIWQGGFVAWAGILAAALAVTWMLRPVRAMVKAQAALLMLAAVWFAGSALLRPDPVPLPQLPALVHLDGRPAMAQGLAGKSHVINLWATWCPPCRRELPMLAEVAEKSSLPILLVNQGEAASIVAAYLTAQGVPGDAVLLDGGSRLSGLVGSTALPTTLFVNAEGLVVSTHVGEISRAALLEQIGEIGER